MTRPGNPVLTLNNGVQLPALGFGVFRSAPEDTVGRRRSRARTGCVPVSSGEETTREQAVSEIVPI